MIAARVGLGLALAVPLLVKPSAAVADILGVWTTPGVSAQVELATCGSDLCGSIVWLWDAVDETGMPRTDTKNSHEGQRARPLLGLAILSGFRKETDTSWSGGRIYNPEDGRTYSARIDLVRPDVLNVSGCVWIFCKSQVWRKLPPEVQAAFSRWRQ